jgi:prophage tail gpP-like protein
MRPVRRSRAQIIPKTPPSESSAGFFVSGATVNDQQLEQQIQARGLTAPRVTLDQVEALMARVTYMGGRVGNTTSTVVHAFLDGEFLLASGHSACVSAPNYDGDIGFKLARGNAEKKARDALWQLEGYALRKQLAQTE